MDKGFWAVLLCISCVEYIFRTLGIAQHTHTHTSIKKCTQPSIMVEVRIMGNRVVISLLLVLVSDFEFFANMNTIDMEVSHGWDWIISCFSFLIKIYYFFLAVWPDPATCGILYGSHEHRDLPDPARGEPWHTNRAWRDGPPSGRSCQSDRYNSYPPTQWSPGWC